jgi:hypothetical protein
MEATDGVADGHAVLADGEKALFERTSDVHPFCTSVVAAADRHAYVMVPVPSLLRTEVAGGRPSLAHRSRFVHRRPLAVSERQLRQPDGAHHVRPRVPSNATTTSSPHADHQNPFFARERYCGCQQIAQTPTGLNPKQQQ